MNPSSRRTDLITALLLSVGAFLVYLRTMSPGVGTEDPGELAVVLHSLGIAHPTGYPIFTMLGALFLQLLPGDANIWRMNLFGAILTAVSVFFFHGVFRFLFSARGHALLEFRRGTPGIEATVLSRRGGESSGQVAAVAATIVYAFSAVFWYEAVFIEVYALHLVFLAIVMRLFLEALAQAPRPSASLGDHRVAPMRSSWAQEPLWPLFAYVLGLSFAHHMMTVLLAPAFLWLFFRVHGVGRAAWGRIGIAAPPFLLALSAYLYLPIRSSSGPALNWGEPTTLTAFWKHITAAQYGQQMFYSWEVAWRKLAQFTVDLPSDFGWPILPVAATGLVVLARRARGLLVFSLLIFVTGLFFAINYAFDDPNFHLHPHFMIALWAAAAIGAAWGATEGRWRIPVRAACLAAALSTPVLLFPAMDKSRDTLVQDYARNVLASVDSGAVLFTNEYERFGSPAFYLQMVEGFRGDVAVLDIILLGNPWYYGHLEPRFPWLMENSREEIEAYRAELDRFILDPTDSTTLDEKLRAMFLSIIEESRAAGRPVYFTANINPDEAPGYRLVPSGMVFLLVPVSDTLPFIPPFDFVHAPIPTPRVNPLSERIRADYAEGYANQGAHLLAHGDSVGAIERFRKALEMWPEFPEVWRLLNSATSPRP